MNAKLLLKSLSAVVLFAQQYSFRNCNDIEAVIILWRHSRNVSLPHYPAKFNDFVSSDFQVLITAKTRDVKFLENRFSNSC